MAKFGINDILNAKTKAAGQQAQTEGYKEIYLSPYEVKAAQENTHQKLEGIEELADSFLHVGQEQPTVLARVNGEYRIIDGHRRNAANILNLERGHKEYEKVLYRFMDMSEAMYELRLLAGNGYTQELTAYEKTRLVERTKAALIRAKEEDGLEIQGKMRDLVAAMINESSTNVARMDAINNNATPEIKEQLKEGNLGITAAYEAAKLDEDEQKEIAEKAAAGENVRAKEIAEKVAEKKAGDDYETPHPESITSLCYSCQKYKDCNVKTGTCQKCDQYINKAEAEKTDEQRYSEEQDAIDRQTKKKLQERADAEKMEHLPSEGNIEHKQHEVKIVASYYEDVVTGTNQYLINLMVKNNCGSAAGTKRRFPLFTFLAQETIDGVAVEYANEVYAQLGQEVKARAQAGKLGYDILLNEREGLFGFYLYKGNDLTATNTEGNTPCIFSRDFDNVNEQEYTASIENCGNFIYVQGAADDDGSQPVTTVDGEGATGLDLVEVFCDATDIARKYQQGETEVTIPLNTYIAMLKTRGGAELENYGKNINFVSTINTNSNLKFKADFDLGDRITCKETKWGIQIDARITEVTETYQKGEETIEATFGDSLPTLVDQIRKVR